MAWLNACARLCTSRPQPYAVALDGSAAGRRLTCAALRITRRVLVTGMAGRQAIGLRRSVGEPLRGDMRVRRLPTSLSWLHGIGWQSGASPIYPRASRCARKPENPFGVLLAQPRSPTLLARRCGVGWRRPIADLPPSFALAHARPQVPLLPGVLLGVIPCLGWVVRAIFKCTCCKHRETCHRIWPSPNTR